jgi:hypothetical protein
MSNTIASLRWEIGGVGDLPFVVHTRKAPGASSDEKPLDKVPC